MGGERVRVGKNSKQGSDLVKLTAFSKLKGLLVKDDEAHQTRRREWGW